MPYDKSIRKQKRKFNLILYISNGYTRMCVCVRFPEFIRIAEHIQYICK